jgi:hypothetical protein
MVAALEAYGGSRNNAILPPNSLEARLFSSEYGTGNDTALRFSILVWLRERIDLILTFGICAITGGLLIGVVSNQRRIIYTVLMCVISIRQQFPSRR